MITSQQHISKRKFNKSEGWFITALLSIIFFPYLRSLVVYVLIKLYELIIQHGME